MAYWDSIDRGLVEMSLPRFRGHLIAWYASLESRKGCPVDATDQTAISSRVSC